MSLARKTHTALYWSTIDRVVQQGVQFGLGIIMARLIVPEEFGLIALVLVFIGISQTLMGAGFYSALIQRKELTENDCATAFYTNLAFAIVLAGILCAISPLVADFYHNYRLIGILCALSVGLIFQSLSGVAEALLAREMNFRAQTMASFPATLISGVFGATWAYLGFGAWALVASILAGRLLNTLMLIKLSRWKLSGSYSVQSFRELFSFGSRMMASGLLETIFNNLNVLVIGKLYAASEVAYYSRAYSLVNMPVGNLQLIVGRVIFPVFSNMQFQPERLRLVMQRSLRLLAFVIFPVLAAIAALSRDIIIVLVGEKWLPTVPLIQLMCVAGSLYCFHALNLTVLTSRGQSKLFLRLEVIKKAIQLAALGVTATHGVKALILGQAASSILALWVNVHYTKKEVGYGLMEQTRDMMPYLCLSLSSAGVIWYARSYLYESLNAWSGLILGSVTFSILYLGIGIGFKLKGIEEGRALLPEKFRRLVPSFS